MCCIPNISLCDTPLPVGVYFNLRLSPSSQQARADANQTSSMNSSSKRLKLDHVLEGTVPRPSPATQLKRWVQGSNSPSSGSKVPTVSVSRIREKVLQAFYYGNNPVVPGQKVAGLKSVIKKDKRTKEESQVVRNIILLHVYEGHVIIM